MFPSGDPHGWTPEQLEVGIVVALHRSMLDQAHWFAQLLSTHDIGHAAVVLHAIAAGTQFATNSRRTAVSVDFDGVLHAYSQGWRDGSIYDSPVPGALVGLWAVTQLAPVFIHTAREPEHVGPWLEARGFDVTLDERCVCRTTPTPTPATCGGCRGDGLLTFWNQVGQLLVTNRKLPADRYVDDRAVTFQSWPQTLGVLAVPSRTAP